MTAPPTFPSDTELEQICGVEVTFEPQSSRIRHPDALQAPILCLYVADDSRREG